MSTWRALGLVMRPRVKERLAEEVARQSLDLCSQVTE
jgi:hypothetical protein